MPQDLVARLTAGQARDHWHGQIEPTAPTVRAAPSGHDRASEVRQMRGSMACWASHVPGVRLAAHVLEPGFW